MQKHESKFQLAFSRWVQNRWEGGPAAFELKRTLTESLPLSAIKEHQIVGLRQVSQNGNFFKIPDGGFSQSPYDCYFLKGKGFVVVAFGPRLIGFYLIPIDVIERLKRIGVVSLKESTAKQFGAYHEFPVRL